MALATRTRRSRILRLLLICVAFSFIIWFLYHRGIIPKHRGYDDSIPWIQAIERFDRTACSQWKECNASQPAVKSSRHDPQWLAVIEHVFVYSAFITDKHPPNRTVEIIAVVEIMNDQFVEGQACWCRFRGTSGEGVDAEIRVLNERHLDRHKTKYGNVRFICDIPANVLTTSITIQCRSPAACAAVELPLHHIPDNPPKPLTFALCHAVLYGAVSAHRLIEFIEFYKLLGIDKFIFYKHDVQPDVQRVLEHYRIDGIVDVYAWVIPGINMTSASKEVHYFEQTAALDDCTERTGYVWDYTLLVDLDEFLVINNGRPLTTLVRNGSDDCVSVRSTQMKLPPPGPTALHQPPTTLLKYATHQDYIWPPLSRSKAVCRGRKVLDTGIHFPHFMVPGVRYDGARGVRTADPDTEAILLHARAELLVEFIDYAWRWEWVSDERGLGYVEPLVVNMDRVVRKLMV